MNTVFDVATQAAELNLEGTKEATQTKKDGAKMVAERVDT